MSGKYTFHTFIETESNAMAKRAGLYVTDKATIEYNILYIWGNKGVGKTHLLYAIQREAKNKKKNVVYMDGEWFVKYFVNGIRYGSMTKFRDKYRNADILLIDNIEKIIGKKNSQLELFYTIESLISSMGHVVITSSKAPKDLNCSNERLESRFVMGLILNISDYSKKEFLLIVIGMAKRNGISLEEYLAGHLLDESDYNMPLIEQYFIDLVSNKEMITENHIIQYMNRYSDSAVKATDCKIVIQILSEFYQIDSITLKSKNRNRNITIIRQIGMYLCNELTNESLKVIGALFNRNHSTVINSIHKIAELVKSDTKVRKEIENLRYNINSGMDNKANRDNTKF